MTNLTYYLLRKKGAQVGDGPYFGIDSAGQSALVPELFMAQRFEQIAEAEHQAQELAAKLGEFEIEVRTTAGVA